jgi:arsenate reductase
MGILPLFFVSLRLSGRIGNLHGEGGRRPVWTSTPENGDSFSMSKSTVTLYGLATCDTTRAARKWLDANGVTHAFHDVRSDGLTKGLVEGWVKQLGWEKVLNKASATWRELPETDKAGLDGRKAVALLAVNPTLVKRPVLDRGGALSLGFKAASYTALFA